MFRLKNRKGQSTVEYILLVTAVVAVMIMFTTNKNSGLQSKLNSTLDDTAGVIETMSDRLGESQTAAPSGVGSKNTSGVTTPVSGTATVK